MRHVNKKPLARNGYLVQTKKTRPRMNYGWIGKTIKKKTDPKKQKKNSKDQSEIAAREKTAGKRIFVQTPFCHSTLKLEHKITPQNTLFRSTSCSGATKITTPI